MSSDSTSIENDLRQLRARSLDEALLSRLEACTDGTIAQLDPVELEFEHRLRGMAPATLSPELMAKLQARVEAVPFPAPVPKIVAFPGRESVATRKARPQRQWWAAAAAVALFGALAGWLVPAGNSPSQKTAATAPAEPKVQRTPQGPLVPAGFNRGLSEASDEGVIWHASKQPHRVLKVVYRDCVTLKDTVGRTYQVEQPRVEYILVPAKTD